MPNGKLVGGPLLLLAVVLALFAAPTVHADGTGSDQRRVQTAVKPISPIEQMDADFVVTQDTAVLQQPVAGSESLLSVEAGQKVWVTGRVRELNWFRVTVGTRYVGYIDGAYLRPESEEAAPSTPDQGQRAAVTAPPAPAVDSPVEPAVGQFNLSEGLFQDCDRCPKMIRLPAGSFDMGSVNSDKTERPVHKVTIAYGFAISRFEVTVGQWLACTAAGACSYEPEAGSAPNLTPVRNVSWDDAQEFVAWLGKVTGKPYRLPSEAEWEYAARAGTASAYWWGDSLGIGRANCKDCGGPWNKRRPATIASYPANPFGIYDLNGGVAEWTNDCWHNDHVGAPADGSSRTKRDCQKRVLRGGSWRDDGIYLRSASRLYYDASVPYIVNGFRVALTLK